MASTFRLLLLFALSGLVHNFAAAQNGVVGYGIDLYGDLCCQACHDSLSSLYLSCTTFHDGDMGGGDGMGMGGMDGMDMGPMGMTSPECYANNTAWLETMAYCIQQNCDADGYPAEKQAACFSKQAVGGASTPTFKESLPARPPTEELASDAMWLNKTSLVNHELYYSTHGTYGEFARQERLHTKYSLIVYLVTIGLITVCGLFAQAFSVLPGLHKSLSNSSLYAKLQSSVFLPALFGSKRLQPLPGQLGYVPGRALSLFIALFIILNTIFSAVDYGNFSPNLWFMSPEFETAEYVGNRTGTLSLVNMSIAILFAGRNNVLMAFTGWSQTTFMVLHRWIARVAAVQAVVHSIAYTVAYFEPGYEGASAYAAMAAQPFFYWGIIGTIALCLAAAFAFLPFRARLYELFLFFHIAFVVIALVGCWYHLIPHFGFDYGYQVWLYLCFAFWAADRVARVARLLYYNGLTGSKAVVEAVPGCDGEILQVTLFPRSTRGFGPGQHSFLYVSGLLKFWESHPFSVAAWSKKGQTGEEKPNVKFLIRAHKGVTAKLRRHALALDSSSTPAAPLTLSVMTEGPYAGHRATLYPLRTADTVVCVAGGVGITHVLGVLQSLRAYTAGSGTEKTEEGVVVEGERRRKRVVLAWTARERALIEHVRQTFDLEGVECQFWCSEFTSSSSSPSSAPVDVESSGNQSDSGSAGVLDKEIGSDTIVPVPGAGAAVKSGKMDVGAVLRDAVEAGQQTAVLVCAPGAMADEVTKQVVVCVKGGFRVDLVEETFAW
ncbi:fcd1ed96-f99e-4d28-9e70-49d2afc1fed5 [Dichotomopilus funicola]|uniref:Fcd1ed96-f99e-4d28-9e70-49d2afc1fed5 n=1 Tax=Dichotomopilus funicola TaxID=1934379 RepID=A0AAN6ZPC8_9PEZI|nr:fcd1ed96-f99e-4d28-9e70-49d2afc1fed5 [Dichotomopilus funicola]